MRLLVLCRHDVAGSWFHLSTLLRQRGIADARVVSFAHDPAQGWPADIADVFDGGQELEHLMRAADAFHLVDLLPQDVALLGGIVPERCASGRVRVTLQIDERPWAHGVRGIVEAAGEHGWAMVETRPNMIPGARFLAPFVPLWRAPWLPVGSGTHARTRTAERTVIASCGERLRDHPRLEALVDRAEIAARGRPEIRVEVLAGRPHAQVLGRQRRSHLALVGDDGLGRAGVEALAQGVPTVVELSAGDHDAWTRLAGAPPPVVPAFALEAAVAAIGGDHAHDLSRRRWAEAAADPRRWLAQCAGWWGAQRTDVAA